MRRIVVKFIMFLANKLGYDIALIKYTTGYIDLQGDVRLIRFVDAAKYMQHIRKVENIK